MSSKMDRWVSENQDQGHYAALAGFCKEVQGYSERLAVCFDALDIYEQIEWFGFVCDLVKHEQKHSPLICGGLIPPAPSLGLDDRATEDDQ
jgi:hypothetical protein